ncbi:MULTISPECIES: TIGR03899 family protein [unclassified Arsukibacterium]|uniref:TIGR03899 family protein n=1 Tax=unclassified Arsukibacterium TaxID=2635278 RepID=UPI000C5411F9|nr:MULTISPECIES: TIGR03899 family protein [unclassified Arsukibacterium]MAA95762.1 TIGR03899 family protein [Rheinheimera sp.]MBM33610.1 TIGR03899 family protein [Rheinheimera sp.]HAW92805.1 TIGR03899 family protein [Candidatus Azambacteria bacterium]
MSKILPASGQQRLLKLARYHLGAPVANKTAETANESAETSDHTPGNAKLQQLVARSGASEPGTELNLAQRVNRRLQMQRERQQQNLEKIMALAMEYCPERVSAQEIDPDWFSQYCELVLNISNDNMQQLWAKILAGEIATPGRFSLKTLQILQQMSHKEAQSLQLAASLSCRSRQEQSGRIYFGYIRKPSLWQLITGRSMALLNLSQFGLSYPQILNLVDIGILHNVEIESGQLQPGQSFSWQFQSQTLHCTALKPGVVLQYYKYTAVGAELLPLLNSPTHSGYLNALQQQLAAVLQFK